MSFMAGLPGRPQPRAPRLPALEPQAARCGRATESVSYGRPKYRTSWHSNRLLGFVVQNLWITRRLMVGDATHGFPACAACGPVQRAQSLDLRRVTSRCSFAGASARRRPDMPCPSPDFPSDEGSLGLSLTALSTPVDVSLARAPVRGALGTE